MGQCTINNQRPPLQSNIQYSFEYVRFLGHKIPVPTAIGMASLYANHKDGFLGKATSTGTTLKASSKVGATQAFPLARLWGKNPLLLRVTRLDTSQSVKVAADDRGPYEKRENGNTCEFIAHRQRAIDLTFAAGRQIDFSDGALRVKIQPELGTAWPPRNQQELDGWIARFPAFQTAAGTKALQALKELDKKRKDIRYL